MKKLIMILFVMVSCLIVAGCGSKTKSAVVPEEKTIAETIVEKRTTRCPLCHGDGVCNHCNGECYRNGRRCSACNGTGNCQFCNGAGSQEVMEMGGKDYTLCGFCHGSGECEPCHGIGKHTFVFSTLGTATETCTFCKGTGKCRNCKGNGWAELKGF